MKYTKEELNDFIRKVKQECISHFDCDECVFDTEFGCWFRGIPSCWEESKKEPEKKIVPFDFSLKEDRDALMGKRIISTSGDLIVTAFAFWSDWGWLLQVDSEFGYDSDYVLGEFVFADTGKPVGKEVEE